MAEKLKLHFFNPVDHLETNEEMIDYLVDCYFDDPEGKVYQKACEFLGASKGLPTAFLVITRATKEIAKRESKKRSEIDVVQRRELRHA